MRRSPQRVRGRRTFFSDYEAGGDRLVVEVLVPSTSEPGRSYDLVVEIPTLWCLEGLQSGGPIAREMEDDALAYLPRVVDAELEARLAAAGAVVIEGPKACGKTETARRRAASAVLLDVDDNARQAAAVDPSLVLEGPTPRLIDEWQI